MKAREYAETIISAVNDHTSLPMEEQGDFLISAIHKVGTDMIAELKQMMVDRKANTNAAVAAVFKEQHMKWRAMCRFIDKELKESLLEPDGFKIIVKAAFPVVYDYMQKNGWK